MLCSCRHCLSYRHWRLLLCCHGRHCRKSCLLGRWDGRAGWWRGWWSGHVGPGACCAWRCCCSALCIGLQRSRDWRGGVRQRCTLCFGAVWSSAVTWPQTNACPPRVRTNHPATIVWKLSRAHACKIEPIHRKSWEACHGQKHLKLGSRERFQDSTELGHFHANNRLAADVHLRRCSCFMNWRTCHRHWHGLRSLSNRQRSCLLQLLILTRSCLDRLCHLIRKRQDWLRCICHLLEDRWRSRCRCVRASCTPSSWKWWHSR